MSNDLDPEAGKRYVPSLGWRIRGIEQSVTYQAILEEGRREGLAQCRAEGYVEGLRLALTGVAIKRFGPPDAKTLSALEAITDPAHLLRLIERLLDVWTWEQLLSDEQGAPNDQ